MQHLRTIKALKEPHLSAVLRIESHKLGGGKFTRKCELFDICKNSDHFTVTSLGCQLFLLGVSCHLLSSHAYINFHCNFRKDQLWVGFGRWERRGFLWLPTIAAAEQQPVICIFRMVYVSPVEFLPGVQLLKTTSALPLKGTSLFQATQLSFSIIL